MNFLVDTHLLVWLSMVSSKLKPQAREILENADNTIHFSAISILEVAIKQQLGKPDFNADAYVLRRALQEFGFQELVVNGTHATQVSALPLIHRDPFDRLLVAQAVVEGFTLLTVDEEIARYPGPILKI
jgi:PIN domain nuclease of toxin-antitoxin system